MSHTTSVETVKITDLSALRSAVQELQNAGVDCTLIENSAPRMYSAGQHGACDFVLRLNKGRYDVGFEKTEEGHYRTVLDAWGNHVGQHLGAGAYCPLPSTDEGQAQHAIGRLLQGYAKHAILNEARKKGMQVTGTYVDEKSGEIRLVLAA